MTPDARVWRPNDPMRWHVGPALNRQCPVCGTIHDSVDSPFHYALGADGRSTYYVVDAPIEKIVVCSRCRAAFGVMTEVPKTATLSGRTGAVIGGGAGFRSADLVPGELRLK